ncbi:MAG TPA: flavodoxin [Intrasporangium sp.]|uniref:NAD(P)H-dependent oxidoreductase n=1 Tax=Intrasporangium sp. TaxID=1925024 RepID=UPI002D78DCBA|nr:flavodoxin [Intrasporangium sp.]HET7399496.1 flavodoxin [Intrasporangium sp.]
MSARLLVVHHTPSPATREVLEAVLEGTRAEGIEGVDVDVHPALSATASDLLAADGLLLGTPANIGYMSGALKHFFDTVYYPSLGAQRGLPYGYWVHGNNDTEGASRAIESIAHALGWMRSAPPLLVTGPVDRHVREAAFELGGTLAARVMD